MRREDRLRGHAPPEPPGDVEDWDLRQHDRERRRAEAQKRREKRRKAQAKAAAKAARKPATQRPPPQQQDPTPETEPASSVRREFRGTTQIATPTSFEELRDHAVLAVAPRSWSSFEPWLTKRVAACGYLILRRNDLMVAIQATPPVIWASDSKSRRQRLEQLGFRPASCELPGRWLFRAYSEHHPKAAKPPDELVPLIRKTLPVREPNQLRWVSTAPNQEQSER